MRAASCSGLGSTCAFCTRSCVDDDDDDGVWMSSSLIVFAAAAALDDDDAFRIDAILVSAAQSGIFDFWFDEDGYSFTNKNYIVYIRL